MCGINATEKQLSLALSSDDPGVSARAMIDAAGKNGLRLTGLKLDMDGLKAIPKPVIAHVRSDHYVVITSADGSVVKMIDPIDGATTVGVDDFREMWQGVVIAPAKALPKRIACGRLSTSELETIRGTRCVCCPPGNLGDCCENGGTPFDPGGG
jgi:ABC-type bacteriocin/lantibiotic exporter with double-glycine peptidase domain